MLKLSSGNGRGNGSWLGSARGLRTTPSHRARVGDTFCLELESYRTSGR